MQITASSSFGVPQYWQNLGGTELREGDSAAVPEVIAGGACDAGAAAGGGETFGVVVEVSVEVKPVGGAFSAGFADSPDTLFRDLMKITATPITIATMTTRSAVNRKLGLALPTVTTMWMTLTPLL